MEYIDLRSDTVTDPTPSMLKAMLNADLGNDDYFEDPTTNKLQQRAADLMGKEAALFVPSGTFGNQLAIFTHCKPSQEVILSDDGHIIQYETGGTAVFSKVNLRPLKTNLGVMDPNEIELKIRKDLTDPHSPTTGLVITENPSGAGCIVPLENIQMIKKISNSYNIPVHMDAARIFYAAHLLGVKPQAIADCSDTLMFCLSKNLCCPVGSLLVGPQTFIDRAKRFRKIFGGAMRQTGFVAAAGLVALDEVVPKLPNDIENAKLMASELNKIPKFRVRNEFVQTNFVPFFIEDSRINFEKLQKYLWENKVKTRLPRKNGIFRYCFHHHISQNDVYKVADLLHTFLKKI